MHSPKLVVWYRDGGFLNNDVSQHPGHGSLLVVDSHPDAVVQPGTGGEPWNERIQAWDAAFGVDPNKILLHTVRPDQSLRPFRWRSEAVPVFDDSQPGAYYDPTAPFASVITPGSGVRVRILKASPDRMAYKVKVSRQS